MPVFKEETISGKKCSFWYVTGTVLDSETDKNVSEYYVPTVTQGIQTRSHIVTNQFLWIKRDDNNLEAKFDVGKPISVRPGNRVIIFGVDCDKSGKVNTIISQVYNYNTGQLCIPLNMKEVRCAGCASINLWISIYPVLYIPVIFFILVIFIPWYIAALAAICSPIPITYYMYKKNTLFVKMIVDNSIVMVNTVLKNEDIDARM